jgi:hypothetical protein
VKCDDVFGEAVRKLGYDPKLWLVNTTNQSASFINHFVNQNEVWPRLSGRKHITTFPSLNDHLEISH